jgi:hypothetical protein
VNGAGVNAEENRAAASLYACVPSRVVCVQAGKTSLSRISRLPFLEEKGRENAGEKFR